MPGQEQQEQLAAVLDNRDMTVRDMRAYALDCAVGYHSVREASPEKVVETAAVFFAYMKRGASE